MKIIECLNHVSTRLRTIYDPGEAESIAAMAMEHYTGISRNQMKWKGEGLMTDAQEGKINSALEQLLQHKPVQYVLGEAWFYDMLFLVNENVLIPRPETEELVHWIINTHALSSAPFNILEIGTGSGCIAVALKKALHHANVTAIDVSEGALTVAKHNAALLQADVNFLLLDFLNEDNWPALPSFDIIVSNPPYIPENEKQKLDAHVAEWEPGTALFVPNDDPLLFYKKIARFGKKHLQHHAEVFAECHQHYADATKQMFEQLGYNTELKKDIFENDRMLRAALMQ